MREERKMTLYTGTEGLKLMDKVRRRGVNHSMFDMLHELGELNDNEHDSVVAMISSEYEGDIVVGEAIITAKISDLIDKKFKEDGTNL